MGSVQRARRARNRHRASGLVLLMLVSTFAAFMSPVQAEISNDDVSISSAIEPVPNWNYDDSDIIYWIPQILVENQYPLSASSRTITMEVCGGDHTQSATCPANQILKEATAQSPNLNPNGNEGDSAFVTFYSFLWFIDSSDISTYAGEFTIMFHFDVEDNNPSNDHLRYKVVILDDLIDLIVNDHDVDTSTVYNSNSPIPANLDVQSRSWPAGQSFSTEWSMHMVDSLVAESQDCVLWQKIHTGQGNMEGTGELILHEATHYNSTSSIYYSPFEIEVGISNTSSRIFGNIAVSGTLFGAIHSVEVIATLNGTELYTETWEFMGDGSFPNTAYNTEFDNGTICFTAKLTVDDILVAQDSRTVEGISGTFGSMSIALPDIVAPHAGSFEVRAWINGTFLDSNLANDNVVFDIVVNDTTDVWIREVVPARGAPNYVQQNGQYLSKFPYGEQSIRVVSGNIGWVTVSTRMEVNLYALSSGDFVAGPYTCNSTLTPGEEMVCDFDFSSTGLFTLNASITTVDGNVDAFPSDNWFEQSIIVDFGAINPTVANPTPTDVFETGQEILAVAAVDPQAPMPLNFTWRMNFMEILGYGQVTNFTMPMGEWQLTLYVEDGAGNLEIAIQPIRILNRVEFSESPYVVSGVSVSTYSMALEFDAPDLPPPGVFYPIAYNRDKEPLVMFNMSMDSPYGVNITVDSIDAKLDLNHFLPPAIDKSTVELLWLPSWTGTEMYDLEGDDTYLINADGTMDVSLVGSKGGSFMLIGELQPVEVNPANLTINLQRDGQVKISWDNEGDYQNPYFGGWEIYRKEIFRFSYPFESEAQFNSATFGYHVLDVSSDTQEWQDPNQWEQGTCLSYLVMAHNRAGVTDWRFGNVSNAVWNSTSQRMIVDQVCVDNSDPATTVDDLEGIVTFNNNTKRHTVEVSWTWPEVDDEGPLTWNLYRAEVVLPSVTFMEPLRSGMQGVPGETGYFNETESALRSSIKVEQTYYYVLVPFDSVGNSDYLVREGNAVQVDVDDMFWEYPYNQPPVEGCRDSDAENYNPAALIDDGSCEYAWDARLENDLATGAFQQAGTVCVAVMILNMLMIPMLINKYKEVKVKIKRKRARKSRVDDFDELFD